MIVRGDDIIWNMHTYNQLFDDKKKILFFTAHPGDIIIFFGALIHKLGKDKKEVFVVTISNNAIQDDKIAQRRVDEEKASLKYLGIVEENYLFLNYKNGEVENDNRLRGDVTRHIRRLKPDMVCTHEPSLLYLATYSKKGSFVQHHDHRTLGETVIDSVFTYSRNSFFFPEQLKESLEPHSVHELLLTDEKECNFSLDFTADFETKKIALSMHKSHFSEDEVHEEINAFNFDGKYLERFNYVKLVW